MSPRFCVSDAVIAKAQELGYHLGCTFTERRNPEVIDPMRISRICIGNDLTLASFRALISGIRGN
jgi:signal recognition particle GTPase